MENQDVTNSTAQEKSFFQRMTKTNLIIMIVSYAIIGVLILTTILLAVIPTYTGVKFENTPDRVVIKTESQSLTLYADSSSTREDFYKVWDAYNASSSPTVIDTIFNGYAGKGKEAVYDQTVSKSYGNLANSTTYSVAFYWDTNQLMTDGNGQQFKYELSSGTYVQDPVYYTTATFAVNKQDTAKQITYYLRRDTAGVNSTSTRFYYTGYASYAGLYNVIEELYDAGKFSV